MFKSDNRIEVRCPFCGAIQKVPCEKYEVPCKKCGKVMIVEEALENLLSGSGGTRHAIEADGSSPDELRARCENCLNAEDYGMALEFAEKAFEKEPESENSVWLLCRAKICGGAPDELLVDYADPTRRDQVVGHYAAERNLTQKMAEYELEHKARAFSCYTDADSDELTQNAIDLALEHGNQAFAEKITREYRLYGHEEIRVEDTPANPVDPIPQPRPNILQEILPNFSKPRSVVEWRTVGIFLFGLAAAIGGVVLILTGHSNGWTIALVVIGVFLGLVGGVAMVMDGRRREIYRYVKRCNPRTLDQIIAFSCGKLPEDTVALQESRYTVLVTVYDLIKHAQLVCVGVRDGQLMTYYSKEGEELLFPAETDDPTAETSAALDRESVFNSESTVSADTEEDASKDEKKRNDF